MTEIVAPFAQFFDTSGAPLANGAIYIGIANLDAETNPIAVFWDEALTIPAAQPIRTLNGYPARNGAPARIYANVDSYSLTARNAQARLMYSALDVTAASSLNDFKIELAAPSGSSLVGFIQDGVGAVNRTTQNKMRDIVSVKDFGAIGNGIADDTSAIVAAINVAGTNGKTLFFPSGIYKVTRLIDLPQSVLLTLNGDGYRNTFIEFDGAIGFAGFNYARVSGTASGFVFNDLTFVWRGALRASGSRAIKSYGVSDALADSYIRCYRCAFYFFENAIETKWSGQCYFVDCFFQANTVSLKMLRGSSFFYLRGCMSFDERFIFAQDTIYDAYSNGLILENCNSITSTDVSMYVQGWQAVYVSKCGFDLGSGGNAAIQMVVCTDGAISDSYISSNNSSTRAGIVFDKSHTFVVRGCTIVNNSAGILAIGQMGVASKIIIDGNKFDGNYSNDIVFPGDMTCCKIIHNHFVKQMSRTSTNFEVYLNTTGTDFNIVQFNTFRGSSYAIFGGAASIIGNNVFDCPAG